MPDTLCILQASDLSPEMSVRVAVAKFRPVMEAVGKAFALVADFCQRAIRAIAEFLAPFEFGRCFHKTRRGERCRRRVLTDVWCSCWQHWRVGGIHWQAPEVTYA